MAPLPVGTLTLLFSDIEGSTSMLTGLGPRWGEALSAHRAILRDAFQKHAGSELGTEGDSFFVVFTSAQQALLAAVTAQRGLAEHGWPGGRPLKVRMGLHTGEPQRHEDGYVGLDVHRAARIAGIAHGGQIVMSASTRALVAGGLDGITLRDLGSHRLKDLPEPEHLYDVVARGLPSDYAPLRSLGMAASLPAYTTELVGRSVEVGELTETIQDGARLVTLTGPGGTGKTRLAVAVARELQSRFPRDIFFVPLQTADRSSLMWAGIAEAVGAAAEPDQTPRERALGFLRDRSALLVLDNLEQVSDADVVASQLLSDARDVIMLATSRRPLHLVDEHQYPVSPLAVPARDVAGEEAARASAVDLFVQRARMVKPGFALTDDNVQDVVTLCRRLDGLPLAIELAAARSRLLGPRALLNRIDSRLGEGPEGPHRSERQRTLAATISWSYDLLAEEHQQVFRRLGVFSSAVGLEAVEHVVGSEERDPLDVVAHLVDVSLLEIVEAPDGEPMIYMLETVRRFARERLEQSGELDDIRLRHARWCVEVASEIEGLLRGPRQMSALDRMDAVEEDIRAALDWSLAQTETLGDERRVCGFGLLKAMDSYWYRFGYVAEGRGWHERALSLVESSGDDDPRIVDALHGHALFALQQNDLVTGTVALERALEMTRRLGDLDREARESNSLGIARRENGDIEGARVLIERSIELARRIGAPRREATALTNVVTLHMDAGEYAAAVDAGRIAAAADEALGDLWGKAINESNLVIALLSAEGPRPAFEWLIEVAPDTIALNDVELSIDVVENFAAVWAALGDGERAASMVGAADAQREKAGFPRLKPDQGHLDRFVVPAMRATDPTRWQRAYVHGRTLSIEDAVAEGSAGREVLYDQAGVQETS